MAEVLLEYDLEVSADDGRSYRPRACGKRMEDDRRWEGWIEFVPSDGSAVLRTPQETVQPDRDALLYWATGLGDAFLQGALERALGPPPAVPLPTGSELPAFSGPAAPTGDVASSSSPRLRPRAVLDPFHVYAQGEDLLRRELRALDASHLRNISRAHDLIDEQRFDLGTMDRGDLVDRIVAAVRGRVA